MSASVRTSVRIDVYVQPRAAKNEISGTHDGRIKIRLAAPPVDGAANAALTAFVAEKLGVAKSCVRVVSGASSRRKVIEIDGLARDAVISALS